MKNPRKTLVYLFLSYLLIFEFGALYIDARQDDLGFLLSIKGYLPWMKYFAVIGLVLFIISYIVVIRENRALRKSVDQAKEEHTMLKAKLFDFQEASKTKTDVVAPVDKGPEDKKKIEQKDSDEDLGDSTREE